jgi:sirohydrochlorin ferrochelatase
MKALIILAHGSRREESNREIQQLSIEVTKIAGKDYKFIEYAYLELVEPTLIQAIEDVVAKGASDITIHPYFLNSGNHLKRDIPEIIRTAEGKYPESKFKISACIGMLEDMPHLILKQSKLT